MRHCVTSRTLLLAGFFGLWNSAMADAIPVELRQTESGWELLRGGEPYFIKGAGGEHSLEALAEAGGNSIRTWDAENVRGDDDVAVLLDEAHALGMTVAVGIWLGHERHGFDYSDEGQVREQFERAKRIVETYKDHPALLIWGIGNEMEGFDEGDNPAIWKAVDDIAAMVKDVDPNHPTMTITTFVHGERIDWVHNKSPNIDIHGINAYGGAVVIPKFLDEGGATKPYVMTEYGAVGAWEMPKTEWGAPIEQTSTDKAAFYRRAYEAAIASQPGRALGGYAFLWGDKMEGTPTWHSMFLPDGAPTGAVDVMTELWSGEAPDNLAPEVQPLSIDGFPEVEPSARLKVSVEASDPEDGALTARWELLPESNDFLTGGDFREKPSAIKGAVVEGGVDGALIEMPARPGNYRLYYYVYDSAGKAATANLPLKVTGEQASPFPFAVYEDSFDNMPWAPSGWMGNFEQLSVDGDFPVEPYTGESCISIRYEGVYQWAGVAWQHPANNWGDMEGGVDVSGATALELWARGAYGGEKVSFGVGLIAGGKPYPDSHIEKVENIELTDEWTRYVVPLEGADLTSLKTGFFIALTGRRTPVTVYLDHIRFVR